jgi:beta-galactosidase
LSRKANVAGGLLAFLPLAFCRPAPEAPPALYQPPPVARTMTALSGPWSFLGSQSLAGAEAVGFDDRSWQQVSLPHTWGRRPLRSAWYRTRFPVAPDPGRRVYVLFEGAATFADVYVNGVHLGRHRGAFTRFVFDASAHVVHGENVLAVRITNDPADTVNSLPSSRGKQLYHLYGGLYRKVWLLTTPAEHIDPGPDAASGVFATPSNVGSASADLAVRVRVRNAGATRRAFELKSVLCDPQGRQVATLEGALPLEAGAGGEVVLTGRVPRPRLWSPAAPHLYTLWTELRAEGRVLDLVRERTGLRDFRFTDGGFQLNGTPIDLRGVAKHQENESRASALTDDDIREDFAVIKDLGVNFVRLAHYPHASLAYDLADEQGLLVWAENGHSNVHKGDQTGDAITREMVRQNYNHPSIVMWSVGNEAAFLRVNRYAAVVKSEDPGRLVTYASNTGKRGKRRYPQLDLIAENIYRGWYRGEPWEFEERALQKRYVSESGGGAVITHHTDYAQARRVVDVFEPEEYRQEIAEVHFQVVFRDHPREVPMYTVWLLRDFGVDKYKGRNTKGLVTGSGFKKDAFYLYKAFLRPDTPVVHIASKTYFLRQGDPANGIKAYSNRPALTLSLNGENQGTRRDGDYYHRNGRTIANVFFWPVALRPGRNDVQVSDGQGNSDSAVLYSPAAGEPELVRDLRSSNPRNPAYWIGQPVKDQWPFYYEFDGTADNSFDAIPPPVSGAGWISTRRLSRPENRTALSFSLNRPADVFVMATSGRPLAQGLAQAGFRREEDECLWRDNDLRLVPCEIHRTREPRDHITVPAATGDYVVLVRERGPGAAPR